MKNFRRLRLVVSAIFAFALPTQFARPILNMMGHRLARGSRVGWSWIFCDFIGLDKDARIGHLNLVSVHRLVLRERSYLGNMNVIQGPISVVLKPRAGIGNRNHVSRARKGITSGGAHFSLGELAKVTVGHRIDCTQTVRIGAFSILAGAGSQVWTHGYIHELEGARRYRIDGRVVIEDNVYVGSVCLISMGVRIGRGVIVGGGTSVSRSLLEPGLYVSSPVRALPRPMAPEDRDDIQRVMDPLICEPVFTKRRP